MTSQISLMTATSPIRRVSLFKTQHSHQVPTVRTQGQRSSKSIIRLTVAKLHESNTPKIQLSDVKKQLLEVIPEPVKQVPWGNAGKIFFNNLLDAGEKGLKFVFVPLVVLGLLSDFLFSVLRNKELLIPVGLFVGCALSDFLNETFQELFHRSEHQSGSSRQLLFLGAFFVVTRFLCASLPLSPRVLFMHIANGGLMQVLWLWINYQVASRNTKVLL